MLCPVLWCSRPGFVSIMRRANTALAPRPARGDIRFTTRPLKSKVGCPFLVPRPSLRSAALSFP